MKMTMHIDEELLDRVIATHGFASKTEAVEIALKELDRKARLKEYLKNGLGWTTAELKNAVDPNYDVMALRAAEASPKYGRKRSAR
jgi:Arc/MetJ family transcription regulator